ncbi:hypothetical protein PDESU_06259 [Pontiella desulfatans]|uniref:Uncharacterized protein n=1 Tax=Pontiella desulfatans TaxID=2750659 RepID=A0A6C2UBW7_PONDE|nr:hypothetical protein [Pontiella desulfatans]VGO17658.1 hypothetical protein PDESU_06259 [Pontiella desulfatans]
MGSYMYRQKPNLVALVAALVSLVGGILTICMLQARDGAGIASPTPVGFLACITLVLTGTFLIIAFARYRFTHLWKRGEAAHSDKYKSQHKKHHHHHRHSHR